MHTDDFRVQAAASSMSNCLKCDPTGVENVVNKKKEEDDNNNV